MQSIQNYSNLQNLYSATEKHIKLKRDLEIAMIVATDTNGIIGKDNSIPWRCSADMKWFRKVTIRHPIIMGRKTYLSIGKPLPKRTNIVMSRDLEFDDDGISVVSSIGEALKCCPHSSKVFVIGGAEIYKQFLPITDIIYKSVIDVEVLGDNLPKFAELSEQNWRQVYCFPAEQSEKESPKCTHVLYSSKVKC